MAQNFLKKNLRANLRLERNALPPAVRQRNDQSICAVLASDARLSDFSQVFFYAAINAEPDLTALAEQWFDKKQLALPVVEGNRLIFCQWQRGDILVPGEFNVPVPNSKACANCQPRHAIVVAVRCPSTAMAIVLATAVVITTAFSRCPSNRHHRRCVLSPLFFGDRTPPHVRMTAK